MTSPDPSSHRVVDSSDDVTVETPLGTEPPAQMVDVPPPVGVTPPQVLARDAAEGRRGAAWRLLHWIMENDPRAVEAVACIDDDRLAQHFLELIALGTWAGKPFVLPRPLRSPHTRTRLRTLFLPGAGMDAERAERVLLAAVHDQRPAMREAAVHILGIMGSSAAVPALKEALNDPVPSVRVQAAKALGRIGDASAVPDLIRALHHTDEQLGSQIFLALVQLGHAAVPALIRASESHSAWVRWQCIRALSEIRDRRSLPVLVQALRDNDHAVAWMAAKGLVRFGQWAVEPILHLLLTTEASPWLVETTSYVLHTLYVQNDKLKPYLVPVMQSMRGAAYQIAIPLAARKALAQLQSDGLIASH